MTAQETGPEASVGFGRRQFAGSALALGVAGAVGTMTLSAVQAPAAMAAEPLPLDPAAIFPNLAKRTTPAWHLARRAALCPTAAIAAEISRRTPVKWLEWQLQPANIPDATVEGLIAKWYPVTTLSSGAQVMSWTNNRPWESAPAMVRATVLRQVFGNRVLLETMTEFWSDMIYVAALGKAESFIGHFNEYVLRRHALGKFSDMLLAAVRHPAVLAYLDNNVNSKDNPNENLGRELLELHTVGVGNYTETDVRQCTLLLTGHSYDWPTLTYRYNSYDHYVGPLKVMGFSAANSDPTAGPVQLKYFTDYLARHPATARPSPTAWSSRSMWPRAW